MLNVGLLGAGRIGAVHAQAINAHPGSRLVAVADVIEENAGRIAASFGADVRRPDEIIAAADIDAVLIATSTDTHADFIEAAAAAGKAVLCEKPVDLSLERARACAAKLGDRAHRVMIGFNRRFDPSFAALKSAVDAGEIGQPEMLAVTSFDPAPPPAAYIAVSGGLYRDMMIHDFDITRFLLGGMPETVYASGTCLVDPDIGAAGDVDTAVVTLTFDDGRICVIRNSRRAAYGYDQRIELLGSKGLIAAENVPETTVVRSRSDGVTAAKPVHFFLERYTAAYNAEWAAFVTMAETGGRAPVSLVDGVEALTLAEAATQSAALGRPVRVADVS